MTVMVAPLIGQIQVPGDKSLSHRVALFSAMASGCSRVSGLLDSLDVRSTLSVIAALGAQVDVRVDKAGLVGEISGWGDAGPQATSAVLQCGNSGTTARLLLGLLSGYDITATLAGDASLSGRPMGRVTLPLAQMGARFEPETHLPITVVGSGDLAAIDYDSPVASAQVKSAILLAGLHAHGTTTVREPHKSRDHTERMLPAYGAELKVQGLSVSIKGGQRLHALDVNVPGDPSSAAFLLIAAAMIEKSVVTARNVLLNPTRTGFLTVMERMGADVTIDSDKIQQLGGETGGDITVRYRGGLEATRIKAEEIATLIDEVPILALLAATAQGETVFEQVSELRVKESDRLTAIINGLSALGFRAWEQGDDLHVMGGTPTMSAQAFATHGDHRLAMTWSVAARAFGLDLNISNPECAAVSYPGFFDDLRRLS